MGDSFLPSFPHSFIHSFIELYLWRVLTPAARHSNADKTANKTTPLLGTNIDIVYTPTLCSRRMRFSVSSSVIARMRVCLREVLSFW